MRYGCTEISTIELGEYFAEPFSIANSDFDNDRDIDMVMSLTEDSSSGTQQGKISYFENDGEESFIETDSHFIPTYYYDVSTCEIY